MKLAHLLGTDHRPSTCCISMGHHKAAMIGWRIAGGEQPGPWRCACTCRRCQRGACPTAKLMGRP